MDAEAPFRGPGFLRLTTFEALRKDTSLEQAVNAGHFTRSVTLPIITTTLLPNALGLGGACVAPAATGVMELGAAAGLNSRNLTICAITGLACIGGGSKGIEGALKPIQSLMRQAEKTRTETKRINSLRNAAGAGPKP